MTDAAASAAVSVRREPERELGRAMRSLPLRWQRAVTALFLTGGNWAAAAGRSPRIRL